MTGRVAGKVCLITGGAMGLGKAEAAALVAEGAQVIIFDVNRIAGEAAARDIGENALFVVGDVCSEDSWRELAALIDLRFGRLDVLVNNAGVIELADIEAATLESWRRINAVSLEGTFLGVKYCLSLLRMSKAGSIINTSSSVALQGVAMVPAYTAAKGAVLALTRTIAVHCMERGYPVRCNVIHPHNVDTPMLHKAFATMLADMPEDQRPDLKFAGTSSVANTVVFLASDESSDLNGASLNLDRGVSCQVAP